MSYFISQKLRGVAVRITNHHLKHTFLDFVWQTEHDQTSKILLNTVKEGLVQLITIKNVYMKHISICKLLNCRPTSALHIGLQTRNPLGSDVCLRCRIATGTGSFKKLYYENMG